MKKSSTSLSRANGRSGQTSRRFSRCPMCGSKRIKLGHERIAMQRGSLATRLELDRWACSNCGEKFLTDAARRRLDEKLGIGGNRRTRRVKSA